MPFSVGSGRAAWGSSTWESPLGAAGRGQGRARAVRPGGGVPDALPAGDRGGAQSERRLHRACRGRRPGRRAAVDGDALRAGAQPCRSRAEGRPVEPAGTARAGAGAHRGAARHPAGGPGAPRPQTGQRPDDRGRAARHRLRHIAGFRPPEPHHDRTDDRHPALHVTGAGGLSPGRHPGLGRVLAGVAAGVRGRRHGTVRRRQPVHNRLSGGVRDPGPRRRTRSAPRHRRALPGQGPRRTAGTDGHPPHAPGAAGIRRHRIPADRTVRTVRETPARPRFSERGPHPRGPHPRGRHDRHRHRHRHRRATPGPDAAHRPRCGVGRRGAVYRSGRLRVPFGHRHHHRHGHHPGHHPGRVTAHAAGGRGRRRCGTT